MSVPFSNTHLRVPQGFGTLLEGLTRGILRDQPEDLPEYAAQYFETLLKQREESGMDPAEWAAKLEDRFYNNHAFKATRQPSPENDTTTDVSSFKEKREFQTEVSHFSTTQPNISNTVNLVDSMEEEETLGMSLERRLSEDESDNRHLGADVLSDDLGGLEEERESTNNTLDHVDRKFNENESAEEEENYEVEEPTHQDVCATELGGTETKMDRAKVENNAHGVEEESLMVPPGEALVQASLSQFETEHQAEINKAEEETENEGPYDDELRMDEAEKEMNSQVEEMESHHGASEIMKRKMDTNEFYSNHSDEDDKGEGVKDISSSHHPTTEVDDENPESETDHKNEDKKSIGEFDSHQNQDFEKQPNFKDDEATDTAGEGYGEMEEEEINDDGENLLSHVTTEGGAFEENDESMESLPQETMEEKEDESKEEEPADEEMVDPEMQEKSDTVCEDESISLTHGADGTDAGHQEEPLGSEKVTTDPDGNSDTI